MKQTKTCLIVDDDADDQEIFLMCLKQISNNEIECLTANNGVEAITMLVDKEYTPSYIFIDVNMPKMNGIDCLRIIKNIDRLKYSKIFMYSTTSEGSALATSQQLGANDFIIKPSSSTMLKEKLSKIFEIVSEINE